VRRWVGFGLILISAASFGAMPIFARFAYASGVDTFTLLALRFTIATAMLAAVLAVRRRALPRGKVLGGLVAMGAVGYVGQAMCYFTALTLASAGLVALLLYLYPALVAAASVAVLKERLPARTIVALAMALAGAALAIGFGGGGTLAGAAFAVGAAVIYTVYIIAGTGLMRVVSPLPATAVIMASAGVVYGALVAMRGPRWPATAGGFLAIAAVAVVTVIATVTFFAALERIGPTNASLLSTFEPVVSVVLAALVLGERLGPLALAGGALILAAAMLVAHAELSRPEAWRKT
jgi:drug/metabolite transporter (DMT)-like permease